jgi:hypothetical protein
MLYTFLSSHRDTLIDRCEIKAAQRSEPDAVHARWRYGVPVFLDQLIDTLKIEKTARPKESVKVSGPAGGPSELSELGQAATQHGKELSDHGFTIDHGPVDRT